jgi:glutamine synthetase
MAGLDGIEKGIDPGEPADYDLYAGNGRVTATTPGSLGEVLEALADDHEYLLKGGVFTTDLIEKYYEYKKVNEADAVAMRPHPYEFDLYFDA